MPVLEGGQGHGAFAFGLKLDDFEGADSVVIADDIPAISAVCTRSDEREAGGFVAGGVEHAHATAGPGIHAADLIGDVGGGAGPVDFARFTRKLWCESGA